MKNPILTLIALSAVVGCSKDPSVAQRLAAHVPAQHKMQTIMGRDFWHGLDTNSRSTPWTTGNPELDNHPAFTDAIVNYEATAQPPPPQTDNAVWPRIEDYFTATDKDRWILEKCPDPTRPFFLRRTCERRRTTWGSPVKVDLAAYRAWRAQRPNMIVDGNVSEWCNDLNNAWSTLAGKRGMYVNNMPDSTNRFEALKRFMGERPKTRYEYLDLMKRYWKMRKERNFDGKLAVLDAHLNTLHIAADFGAAYLRIETTATGPYRYQPTAMFTRGAARQFGLPWEWYIANYMNGPSKAFPNTFLGDAVCHYAQQATHSTKPFYAKETVSASGRRSRIGNKGAEFGISRSLFKRTHYLAYLSGANVVWLESWPDIVRQWDKALGKSVFSPRGRIYADFIDFTRAHPDRGTHYSPVAVCVPLAQGYPTWGGSPFGDRRFGYTKGDQVVNAVFSTLVPDRPYGESLARGDEILLRNTPHADMYDVIVPDTESQSPEQKLAVMKSYKALLVAGDYRDTSWEEVLARYEAEGGQVIRVDDADVPKLDADLRKLEEAYFPFAVSGSCAYGLTVAPDHVWLYVFNHDGIIKFADAPEEVDETKASDITVALRPNCGKVTAVKELLSGKDVSVSSGTTFRCHLKPGDFAIFEIK